MEARLRRLFTTIGPVVGALALLYVINQGVAYYQRGAEELKLERHAQATATAEAGITTTAPVTTDAVTATTDVTDTAGVTATTDLTDDITASPRRRVSPRRPK